MNIINPIQAELVRAAAAMAAKGEFQHLLYVGDLPLPDELVRAKSVARKKLVQAVTNAAQRQVLEAMGVTTIALPTYDIARRERFKIAMLAGIAAGIFARGDVVLAIVGRGPTSYPDTLFVIPVGDDELSPDRGFNMIGSEMIGSPIVESVLDLAVEIARNGWEGHPLGTLLVLGDTATVMEKSRQLTLNPFQGYSEAEKNILNPAVRQAIKNFAVLDGAFVIREDGVVLAAGRYIRVEDEADLDLPLGLGSRHVAGAAISRATHAIAVVVSETSGVTRVFRAGHCALVIEPEAGSGRRTGEMVDEGRSAADDAKGKPKGRDAKDAKDKDPKDPKDPKDKEKDAKDKDREAKDKDAKDKDKDKDAKK
jgi:hypothetical protein